MPVLFRLAVSAVRNISAAGGAGVGAMERIGGALLNQAKSKGDAAKGFVSQKFNKYINDIIAKIEGGGASPVLPARYAIVNSVGGIVFRIAGPDAKTRACAFKGNGKVYILDVTGNVTGSEIVCAPPGGSNAVGNNGGLGGGRRRRRTRKHRSRRRHRKSTRQHRK
jgi:hypothetical protein